MRIDPLAYAGRLTVFLVGLLLSGFFTHASAQPSIGNLRTGAVSSDHQAEVLSHDMEVELDPDRHHIHVNDRVTIKALDSSLSSLSFILN